jgi:hypothetical protein
VEVNCLDTSRFYAADVQRSVAAVESMDFAAVLGPALDGVPAGP